MHVNWTRLYREPYWYTETTYGHGGPASTSLGRDGKVVVNVTGPVLKRPIVEPIDVSEYPKAWRP